MSLIALTKTLERTDLPSPAKFVLLILANYANEEGVSYPSIPNIAKKTSLSERSVQMQLKLLEELKLVSRTPRTVNGSRISNVYRLHLEGVNEMQGVVNDVHQGGERDSPGVVNDVHPNTKERIDTKEDTKEPPISPKPKKAVRVKKVPTTIPDDFEITPEMRAWADKAVPMLDIDFELSRFIDRCLAKGTVYADWVAGWRTQMKNAVEWGQGKLKATSKERSDLPPSHQGLKVVSDIDRQLAKEGLPPNRITYEALVAAQSSRPEWFNDREKYEQAKEMWLDAYQEKADWMHELCLKEVAEYESGPEFAQRFPE